MDEAHKTNKLRGADFVAKYLSGTVIDIGAGNDLVCEGAEPFDMQHGDANFISRYRTPGAYDTVHSSHCLEHMVDPAAALAEWWKLVRPGGYLIVVVPEEDLYEQGIWPSRFNRDHKATFRLRRATGWSPVSQDLAALFSALPNSVIISAELQDANYDYALQRKPTTPLGKEPVMLTTLRKLIPKSFALGRRLRYRLEDHAFRKYNVPVDQTRRDATAQIQVVAQRAAGASVGG